MCVCVRVCVCVWGCVAVCRGMYISLCVWYCLWAYIKVNAYTEYIVHSTQVHFWSLPSLSQENLIWKFIEKIDIHMSTDIKLKLVVVTWILTVSLLGWKFLEESWTCPLSNNMFLQYLKLAITSAPFWSLEKSGFLKSNKIFTVSYRHHYALKK